MSSPGRPLTVNTVELLRVPGAQRSFDAVLTAGELELVDDRLAGDIVIDVLLESALDGIVVSGTISAPWRSTCRRCVADIEGVAVADVHELYQKVVTDPDAFPIEEAQLDLARMVRELVLLELPDAPLCRDDCAGLCPECGADRNQYPCSCATVVADDRWAALDELRLDD